MEEVEELTEVLGIIKKYHDNEICRKTMELLNIGGAEKELIRQMGITIVDRTNEHGSKEEMNELMSIARRRNKVVKDPAKEAESPLGDGYEVEIVEVSAGTGYVETSYGGNGGGRFSYGETGGRRTNYGGIGYGETRYGGNGVAGNGYARNRIIDLVSPLYRSRFNPRNAPGSYEMYKAKCTEITLAAIDEAKKSLLGILGLRLRDAVPELLSENDIFKASSPVHRRANEVEEYINACQIVHGRRPSVEEISVDLGYSVDSIKEYILLSRANSVPITGPFRGRESGTEDGSENLNWQDVIADPRGSVEDQWFEAADVKGEIVRNAVRKLKDEAERDIILNKYRIEGCIASVRDIRRRHGLTADEYEDAYERAIGELREALKDEWGVI